MCQVLSCEAFGVVYVAQVCVNVPQICWAIHPLSPGGVIMEPGAITPTHV